MQGQLVFQEETEIKRLAVQNRLLAAYEAPIFSHLIRRGSSWKVLDIGCNDGKKTAERFSFSEVSGVIGLEYNPELSEKAQRLYGGDKFSFYPCDVEAPDFTDKLTDIMRKSGIGGFDVIYLSFVLMHLRHPEELLRKLRPFLAQNGSLVVIEANDSASVLEPDGEGLLGAFLDILKKDPLSGNRKMGAHIQDLLSQCGYGDITLWHHEIRACEGETEKKKDIFQTFFSYLPEDVAILSEKYPDNEEYKVWSEWLETNYDKLEDLVLQEKSHVSMGMKMLSCTKG